jgi:hypothetical protein
MTQPTVYPPDYSRKPVLWGCEKPDSALWHTPPTRLRRPQRLGRHDHLRNFRSAGL